MQRFLLIQVVDAVPADLLEALCRNIVLHVGPVVHNELLLDRFQKLVGLVGTLVHLRLPVVTVKRVASVLLKHVFEQLSGIFELGCAHDCRAVAFLSAIHGALARDFEGHV
jgi:hypothetical protein